LPYKKLISITLCRNICCGVARACCGTNWNCRTMAWQWVLYRQTTLTSL